MLDCTYRVQIPHALGQLALVAGAIARGEGLIGDVSTISIGREHSIREITVEVRDTAQAARVAELVDELPGARVLWHRDRALIAHEGGKLRMDAVHLGAAGFGIASLMVDGGARRVIAFDPSHDAQARAREHGIELGSMEEVMELADVVVATTGRPGLIQPSMIRRGQVILALSNPDPEISPEEAERAGAAFASDGRSVNNVLGYPGIFRGALQAGASRIDREMKLAAAHAIAALAPEAEIVPNVLDQAVHDAVAEAVREAAKRSGVARPELATVGL